MNSGNLLRGTILLGLIWAVVWGITSWSGSRKATPAKVSGMIREAEFENWSVGEITSHSESRSEQRIERNSGSRASMKSPGRSIDLI